MPALGVTVTTSETPQSGGVPTNTSTAFIAGLADQGPATAQLVRSVPEYIAIYGPRSTTSSVLFDSLDAYFREGGVRAYVARVTDSTATTASVNLNDSGAHPTLTVSAKTPGVDGNNLLVAVAVTGTSFVLTITDSAGDVLETSPTLANQAAAIAWAAQYVTVAAATGVGATTLNPVAVSATPLIGGANANDLTDNSYVAALTQFVLTLGPGQVLAPGRTSATVWNGLLSHAQANNRFACLDVADSPVASTLVAAIGTTGTAANASYGAFFASQVTVPGLTPGTTRTVPASAVGAALCASVSQTGNDNQAPAGQDWALEYVTGFTQTYNQADTQTLNNAGINTFANRYNTLCLFGFSTPISQSADLIFWQASASRERMALVAGAQAIAEPFLFNTLDGRNITLTAFKGQLQGLVARHWASNALYGLTAAEAGLVLVDPPANTPATEAAGQLNASLVVRISPFAQYVTINIASTPITNVV